jgi:hypothetical protein
MRSRSMVRSLPCLRQLLCLGPAVSEQASPAWRKWRCSIPLRLAVVMLPDGCAMAIPYRRPLPLGWANQFQSICLSSNLCTCKKEGQQVNRRKRLLMDVQNTLLFRTTTVWHTCSTHKAHPHPHPHYYHSYPIPMLRDTTCFFLIVNPGLHPRECHDPVLRSAPLSLV